MKTNSYDISLVKNIVFFPFWYFLDRVMIMCSRLEHFLQCDVSSQELKIKQFHYWNGFSSTSLDDIKMQNQFRNSSDMGWVRLIIISLKYLRVQYHPMISPQYMKRSIERRKEFEIPSFYYCIVQCLVHSMWNERSPLREDQLT